MIKSVTEIQELITWCRKNGVQQLKLENLEFTLSSLAIAAEMSVETSNTELNLNNKSLESDSEEDLLFWSSK